MNSRFVKGRQELKYVVDLAAMESFLQQVDPRLALDDHGPAEGYAIHSVYFDDTDLTFFEEKMADLATRMKPRLRAYADTLGGTPGAIFLEFKYRDRGIVSKERATLTATQAARVLAGDPGPDSADAKDCDVMSKFADLSTKMGLTPLVAVRYHRLAFSCDDPGKTRLTFDRRIECAANCRLDAPIADFVPLLAPNRAIIEIKYRETPPAWLLETVAHLRLRAESFSKYANSIQRIHQPALRATS